jgi:hypothetical protein
MHCKLLMLHRIRCCHILTNINLRKYIKWIKELKKLKWMSFGQNNDKKTHQRFHLQTGAQCPPRLRKWSPENEKQPISPRQSFDEIETWSLKFCWAKHNHRMLSSTPPPPKKIGNDCQPGERVRDRNCKSKRDCAITKVQLHLQSTSVIINVLNYKCNLQASLNHKANVCSCYKYSLALHLKVM